MTEYEIMNEINKLNPRKSPGDDNITAKILQRCSAAIAKPLAVIFNNSFENAVYPTRLKLAKVLALFKKNNPLFPENYRPISLLSCIDKLFEKLVYNRFMKFIVQHKILYVLQFGFRQKHSTTLALIDLIDNIKNYVDNGEYALGIYLDLKKAFDTVDHKILLTKLDNYGFRGHVNHFICSYLSDRKQYSVVNGHKSDIQDITVGVPQGSVLGPLFFLLYVNDIKNCLDDEYISLFADDTSVLIHNRDLHVLKTNAERTIGRLYTWFNSNKLSLSIEKTHFIIYHTKRRQIDARFNKLTVHGFDINRVTWVKHLGLIIDENLSWEKHVQQLCNSLSRYFSVFYNIRGSVPNAFKRQLYYSLVYSRVQYGIEMYGTCRKTLLDRVQVIQNKLLKVLYQKDYRTGTNELHKELNLLKVDDIYKYLVLQFVYKTVNRLNIDHFSGYFRFREEAHGYNLRNKNYIVKKRVKTNYGKTTTQFNGATLWNEINSEIKAISSMNAFKRAIRGIFMNKY